MAGTGYLKRLTKRLTDDVDELDAETMELEIAKAGRDRAKDCSAGIEASMVGELRSVQTCAKGATTGVIAEFYDGTDIVILKWLGRNRIPGVDPGRRIQVTGRVGEHDGRKVIYNPLYELLADDDA